MRIFALVTYFFLTTAGFAGRWVECEAFSTTAANLAGLWEYDSELSSVLGDTNNHLNRIRFTEDNSALERLFPWEKYLRKDVCVYLAGFVDIYTTEGELLAKPFILTTLDDVITIYWYDLEKEGIISYDGFEVALAAGADNNQDRLILGDWDEFDDYPERESPMKFLKRVLD